MTVHFFTASTNRSSQLWVWIPKKNIKRLKYISTVFGGGDYGSHTTAHCRLCASCGWWRTRSSSWSSTTREMWRRTPRPTGENRRRVRVHSTHRGGVPREIPSCFVLCPELITRLPRKACMIVVSPCQYDRVEEGVIDSLMNGIELKNNILQRPHHRIANRWRARIGQHAGL